MTTSQPKPSRHGDGRVPENFKQYVRQATKPLPPPADQVGLDDGVVFSCRARPAAPAPPVRYADEGKQWEKLRTDQHLSREAVARQTFGLTFMSRLLQIEQGTVQTSWHERSRLLGFYTTHDPWPEFTTKDK